MGSQCARYSGIHIKTCTQMLEFSGFTAHLAVNSVHQFYALGSVMSFQISVPAILTGMLALGVIANTHAQPGQSPAVGADRIYAAEARAAALKAENEQLRQSVSTQSAALKRLDDEINLLRSEHDLQLKNLREAKIVADGEVKRLEVETAQQAQNEASLADQAAQAQAQAVRLEGLLTEQQARNQAMAEQLAQLQAANAEQQNLLAEAPRIRTELEATTEQNNALRDQLAQARDELSQLQTEMASTQTRQAEQAQVLMAETETLQSANANLRSELENARTELVELRRMIGAELQPTIEENTRMREQLSFLQKRNEALQVAMSEAASSEEVTALYQQNTELQDAVSSRDKQLATLQEQLLSANQALAQAQQNSQSAPSLTLQEDHAALQNEYNQLLDGIRSCEAKLQTANANAAQPRAAAAEPSSQPEDIRRIAELEAALDRANGEIRTMNRALEQELQVERAMAAGTQAEMEQQFQTRVNALQTALETCQAN